MKSYLPVEFIRLHHQPDGTFPNGVPNPLLPEKRAETAAAVVEHRADFGIAWDGDFDRCFFWDEQGRFIEGYYMVGLLAVELLGREPGAKILHDPRLIWNTIELVREAGGVPVQTRTGHALIKERMWQEGCSVWRRDVRPSLFQGFRLLRLGYDSLAAGLLDYQQNRQTAVAADRFPDAGVSDIGRDQYNGG